MADFEKPIVKQITENKVEVRFRIMQGSQKGLISVDGEVSEPAVIPAALKAELTKFVRARLASMGFTQKA